MSFTGGQEFTKPALLAYCILPRTDYLGSELQRKAAAILSIEKDDDPHISVVKALKVRDESPLDVPLIQFSWDKAKGIHVFMREKTKEEKEKHKETELDNIARNVFSDRNVLHLRRIV